jgi:hypothetical protein
MFLAPERAVGVANHGWYNREERGTSVFSLWARRHHATGARGRKHGLRRAVRSVSKTQGFDRRSGAGFAAYVMDRLDEKFDRFGASLANTRLRPSEYFRRNLWYVMDPGERSIDANCDLVGEERFLWGSDYPHIDSHINAADEVRASLAGMTESRRRAVLGENGRKLFGLA